MTFNDYHCILYDVHLLFVIFTGFYSILHDFHRLSLIFVDCSLVLMASHRSLVDSLTLCDSLWLSVALRVSLCFPVALCGPRWPSADLCGPLCTEQHEIGKLERVLDEIRTGSTRGQRLEIVPEANGWK